MKTLAHSESLQSAHLGCKHVEVACAIRSADEFTFVLWWHSRVFGDPDHRGGKSVSVEAVPIEGFALLLSETFTWKNTLVFIT